MIQQDASDLVMAFRDYGNRFDDALDAGIEAACLFVESEAKKLSPVDTSLLKNSITHTQRKTPNGVSGFVGTNVEYAPFQEFGTSRQEAANNGSGFLTPALNDNKATVQALIAGKIGRVAK